MIVVDCEQRTSAWFAARAGLLTATGAQAMLSRPKKGTEMTAGKSALITRLALESLRGVPIDEDPFESDYMRRGREREADGLRAYEAATGNIVMTVGFCQHHTLPAGCSPDGLIGSLEDPEGGLELKAPKYTTHREYLKQQSLPSEYAAQVTHSLFVTGLPWWDFCSYCPEFDGAAQLFVVRVPRDEPTLQAYELAFRLFWSEVEAEIQLVRELSVGPCSEPAMAVVHILE